MFYAGFSDFENDFSEHDVYFFRLLWYHQRKGVKHMNILCENIRALRKARGLTQKELAEQLEISDKTVSRWESGVQLPEASLIPQLASVFGVTIDELYGVEKSVSEEPAPKIDDRKTVLDFQIWMIAGALISLLGSLLYRYFGSVGYLTPSLIDADYYNTAKGATADIFAFVGIIAIFLGLFAVIIAKVRFAGAYKPHMPDSVYALNVRLTGAAIIIFSVIFMKTAPEILSFGFIVPRQVYGCIFVAALTGVLMWYRRQLNKRGITLSKPLAVTALTIGGLAIAATISALIWRDSLTIAFAPGDEVTNFASGSSATAGVSIAGVMLSVADWLIIAMPVLLYIELLVKLRKIR